MVKSYQYLELDWVSNKIAVLTLNDPKTLNALSIDMALEVTEAVNHVMKSNPRCVVLTGKGRFFCSGQNLKMNPDQMRVMKDVRAVLDQYYHPMLKALKSISCPLVTALNGPVVGFGVGMALLGDMIVVSDSTYLMLPFSNIALVPDGGATYLLSRLLGPHKALSLFFLCERMSANELMQQGIAYKVYSDADLLSHALDLATRLASGPRQAYRLGKQLIWDALDQDYHHQLLQEQQAQNLASHEKDFILGIKAFLSKSSPKFE
ncbi:MAG: enoyl-CoA hydratase-related protein [Pseudomonadota bacterium]|nr:enoyl-CoA hydratase-related protein [Pseudomonadota bacterium]